MIRGLHHTGISVQDLERSINFYRTLGMEVVQEATFAGESMERITGLPGTHGRAAMLRVGAQHLELFEFTAPRPKPTPRAVCDHGISHFCIQVADIENEYKRLRAAGVEFHCAPQSFGNSKATYMRDPDGNIVELLQSD
jgi:catechol 2,3-dioxygenase-like lactoylglutathione lyase family enzyme